MILAVDVGNTNIVLGVIHEGHILRTARIRTEDNATEAEYAIKISEILYYMNASDRRDPKNGFVTGVRCIRMELTSPDEDGRRRPVPVPGSEFLINADAVIMAIGTSPNPLIKNTTEGLEVNKYGGIVVNEDGLTSIEGVYAGGDAVTGAATVILAMGAGRKAAKAIDDYLKNN